MTFTRLRVISVLFLVTSIIGCTHRTDSPHTELLPPDFDSLGPPTAQLAQISDQWQRIPSARLEKAFRWDTTQDRRVQVNRILLPYDSRTEANPVRHLFHEVLDTPQLRTGILLDTCPGPTKHLLSQQRDPVDLSDIQLAARQLSECASRDENFVSKLSRAVEKAQRYFRNYGLLPIIVVDMDVERFQPGVWEKVVINANGVFQVPDLGPQHVERRRVFMAAPLRDSVGFKNVKLVVDDEFVVSNRTNPDSYWISVNGRPEVRRKFGESFTLRFSSAGDSATMSIQPERGGPGQITSAQTRIHSTLVPSYDLTWVSGCHPVSDEGEDVWIRPYVFFGESHDPSDGMPHIQNPFVILGGYDEQLFGNWSRMYAEINGLAPGNDLIERLRTQFDVVLLEYSEIGVSLELNAQALACVLLDINERNHNRDGIVLVGISMGGLVSRMTLTGMENDAIEGIDGEHQVRFWATIDAPHQGAHMPLGLQFLADHYSWLPVDEIEQVNRLINSRASREMLLEHHSFPESVTPARTNHLNTLDFWGSFPTDVGTTVALASGSLSYPRSASGSRVYQNTYWIPPECPESSPFGFTAGCVTTPEQWLPQPDNIVHVQQNTNSLYFPQDNRNGEGGLTQLRAFFSLNFGGLPASVYFGVWARPVQDRRWADTGSGGDRSETTAFSTSWNLNIIPDWVVAFVDNPSGSSQESVTYGSPLSTMAGGWLTTPQDIFDALEESDIGTVEGPLYNGLTGSPMPRHTFVPTWSTLDISEEYLEAMYDWLTRYGPSQIVWESWYGSNYLGGRALSRGHFSYDDFVDFDRIMFHFNSPDFDGRIRTYSLRSAPITEDPETGEVQIETVEVRPSPFDWVYFNAANRRHGEIDAAGLQFFWARLNEELGNGTAAGTGTAATDYRMMETATVRLSFGDVIERFIDHVEELGLDATTETEIVQKLEAAASAVENGDTETAITELDGLISDTESMRGNELTDQQAQEITNAVNTLIGMLS